jgi:hypothetical protein
MTQPRQIGMLLLCRASRDSAQVALQRPIVGSISPPPFRDDSRKEEGDHTTPSEALNGKPMRRLAIQPAMMPSYWRKSCLTV